MASVLTRLLTAEEFFDFTHQPENRDRHFELVRGDVVKVSRPGDRHKAICANASYILVGYTRAIKRGRVTTNDTGRGDGNAGQPNPEDIAHVQVLGERRIKIYP